jgi:hypothetical protein
MNHLCCGMVQEKKNCLSCVKDSFRCAKDLIGCVVLNELGFPFEGVKVFLLTGPDCILSPGDRCAELKGDRCLFVETCC